MPDYSSASFLPPADWQAFERASRVLYAKELNDPLTQTNGTSGQRQHGVDIFGRRDGRSDHYVGIQCKGKDGNYRKNVTEKELRAEVKKTEDFKPALKEFFLITTAKDDAPIQEVARLLQHEVRAAGRDLSIAVLGWGQLEQRIRQYDEAIRAFHPDAFPQSDRILDETRQVRALVAQGNYRDEERHLELIEAILLTRSVQITSTDTSTGDALEVHLNAQIDSYREYIKKGYSETALQLFTDLKKNVYETASAKIKYRIIANIAAALHNLQRNDEAVPLFLEAYDLNPDDPSAKANRIAAYAISGRADEARDAAEQALKAHPDNPDIAFQRLQTLGPDESLGTVWNGLSNEARSKPELYAFRVAMLREGGDESWRQALIEFEAKFPADPIVKVMKAEEVLDRFLGADAAVIGAVAKNAPKQHEVNDAAAVMEERWDQTSARQGPVDTAPAYNAALIHYFNGDNARAKNLLDAAMKRGKVDEEAIRLRVSLASRENDKVSLAAFSERLGSHPRSLLLKADILRNMDPAAAIECLVGWSDFENRSERLGAATLLLDISLQRRDFVLAHGVAEQLGRLYPDDPAYLLAQYRVLEAEGKESAIQVLLRAARQATRSADLATCFQLAEELGEVGKHEEAVNLLLDKVSYERDTPPLRLLIASAANADRRSTLNTILSGLPADLKEKPYFIRASIALAIRMGDIKGAEHHIRRYLEKRSRSLEMHLQLMQILLRQGRADDLGRAVSRPAGDFDAEPEVLLQYAQFKDVYGNWREAHALAYRVWVHNQTDPEVSMRYVGLFLAPRHSQEMEIAPPQVEADMAVGVRSGTRSDTYIIEPDAGLRVTAFHLSPDHPIAAALIAKKVGETVTLPGDPQVEIAWIKTKQLHVLHELLQNIPKLFPSVTAFESIEVDFKREEGQQPLTDRLKARHEGIEHAFATYATGQLPIALLAKWLGTNPVDAMLGLINTGRTVFVCDGRHEERGQALAAVGANKTAGCVVDAVTLHVIRRLNLTEAVEAVCGRIGIVQGTLDDIQTAILQLEERPSEPDLALSWQNGQMVKIETSVAQKIERLRMLQDEKVWIERNLDILPSKGKRDLPPEWRDLTARFEREVFDELVAAEGTDRLLISEDRAFRRIGQGLGVRATWLLPVLMKGLAEERISRGSYCKALISFIQSNFDFVSVDSKCLEWALGSSRTHPIPDEFATIASCLGGANADLPSHYNVIANFLKAVWPELGIHSLYKFALAGRLLENLVRGRTLEEVWGVFLGLAEFGRDVLKDPDFITYLRDWLRGHFIDLRRR